MKIYDLVLCAFSFAIGIAAAPSRAAEPLVAEKPVAIPDAKDRFDFLEVDAAQRRFLAPHTVNGTLDVFDLDSGKLIKHVPTGKAQSVAIDEADGKYFVGVSKEQIVAVVNSKTLEKTGEVKISGPADGIAFDSKNGRVYVDNDDGTSVWVIDAKSEKIIATITIPEAPEYVLYDPASDTIFQNIKSSDQVLAIDPNSNVVKEKWSTGPAKKPHGLALDAKTHRLFCAGNNGKLAVIDSTNGKLIASVDIATGTDQIAFDPGNKRIYCGCGGGIISVVEETADGARLLGNVKTPGTGRTLAVDPKTHAVWTAYGDKSASFTLKLFPQ